MAFRSLLSWTARSGYPISNIPSLTLLAAPTLTTRNYIPVLSFPDTTPTTHMGFDFIMPQFYSAPPPSILVTLGWAAAHATSLGQDVMWDVRMASFTPDADDIDSNAFATGISSVCTEASVAGEIAESLHPFTNTEIDGIEPGEWFRIDVVRVTTQAADTLVGAAHLVYIKVEQEEPIVL